MSTQARRRAFVVDPNLREVFGWTGRPIRGAWRMLVDHCRHRGVRLAGLEDEAFVTRNRVGEVVVRRLRA